MDDGGNGDVRISTGLAARLDAIEQRLRRLERGRRVAAGHVQGGDHGGGEESIRSRFWALEGLAARLPADAGAVVFTGVVPLPTGEKYRWQWQADTGELLESDWSDAGAALAALGHPVRLLLLRQVLHGARTVAALQAVEGLGTSGQLYHHLRQLVAAGWLRATARGQYGVPPERVVPLLVALAAARP